MPSAQPTELFLEKYRYKDYIGNYYKIDCRNQHLSEIPPLPNTIKIMLCDYNKLKKNFPIYQIVVK